MTESELIDQILKDAQTNYISPHRAMPNDYEQALYKAERLGLVKKHGKISYILTERGQEAFDLGGIDKWRENKAHIEQMQSPSLNIGDNNIFGNNNSGNTQGFSFRDTSRNISPAPRANEKHQKAKISIVEKWIVPIIIAVVGGLILLYIEYKTGFFGGK